jgi:hypothetical protein
MSNGERRWNLREGKMRLKIFDLIDLEGWTLPVGLKIDESQGFPDVIVETYDDLPEAM